MMTLRGIVYRLGFRPRPGTIFYSPSIAYALAARDAVAAMARALKGDK